MKAINLVTVLTCLLACRSDEQSTVTTAEVEELQAVVLDLQQQIAECAKTEETAALTALLEAESAARAETDETVAAIQADYVMASDLEGFATEQELNDLDAKVAANESAIGAQAVALSAVQSDVAANAASLTTLWTDISANSAGVGANATAITALQGAVSTNTTAVANHWTAISANSTDIANHWTAISANSTDIANHWSAISANSTDIANHWTSIANNSSAVTSLQGSVGTNASALTQLQSTYVSTADLDAMTIVSDEIWTVGPSGNADYPDLHQALDAAYDVSIHPNALLTLQLEAGTHSYTETVEVRHPDGDNLRIHGDLNDPAAVQLQFNGSNASSGIRVDDGHSLRSLRGMTLLGDGVDTANGLFAYRGANVFVDDVVVSNWVTAGIYVTYGSIVFSGETVEAHNNVGWGVLVSYRGIFHGSDVHSHSNDSGIGVYWDSFAYISDALVENNTTGGVRGAFAGTLDMRRSISRNNGYYGFDAGHGTVGYYANTVSDSNGYDGYFAYEGGLINADNASSTGNGFNGFKSGLQSYLRAYGATYSSNGYGPFGTGTTDDGYNRLLVR